MSNVKKQLWIITGIIHTIMIAIISLALSKQVQAKINFETTATMAQATSLAYQLTHPSPTKTPFPTETVTPLPTPTETPVPCFGQLSTGSHTVYLQPSYGRTIDSIQTTESLLPLFAHLKNENWWLTQAKDKNGSPFTGWINTSDILNSADCNDLKMASLESLLLERADAIPLADTFSAFDYEWKDSSGNPPKRQSDGNIASLQIRSGGLPTFLSPEGIVIHSPFELRTSFTRMDFDQSSYIGAKWISQSSPENFIELRILSGQCNAVWVYHVDNDQGETPPITLGAPANCESASIEDFFFIKKTNNGNTVRLEGTYNDANLPPLTLNDPNVTFGETYFNLVVFYGEVIFNYVLINEIR